MNRRTLLLTGALLPSVLRGQDRRAELSAEHRKLVDAALPEAAQAKPRRARRILVSNLAMRNGQVVQGHSNAAIPVSNYAIAEMGRRTGAYEAVFDNDIERFRPDRIREFDALCFNGTMGVLFEDAELKKSLMDFIEGGKGFIGIHDALATFVQYPKYDQWPEFGRMLGGTENGGHPWDGVPMMMRVEDPGNPVNAAFGGKDFEITDQAFQLQEPTFRDRIRVLLSIDASRTVAPRRNFLPVRREDKDFPMSWIRRHVKGRVFFFGLGHNAPVFWNAPLLKHLLDGTQYALGDLQADDSPMERKWS